MVLPHVLHRLGGQDGRGVVRLVDPGVVGGVDGELPLQLAVLGWRRLVELSPGPGWWLDPVTGETTHLQTGPASLLRVYGHTGQPQPTCGLHGLGLPDLCLGEVRVLRLGEWSGGVCSGHLLLRLWLGFPSESRLIRFCSSERKIVRLVSDKLSWRGIPGGVSRSNFLDLSL